MAYQITKYACMSNEGPRLMDFHIADDIFATSIEYDDNTLTMKHVTQDIIDGYDFAQHQGMTVLTIIGDYIHKLTVPEGVEYVYCSKCGIREIYLPDSVKLLVCDDNYLSRLDLPAGIEVVEANNNYIHSVSFRHPPTNLSVLELKSNRLLSLGFDVPESLSKLDIDENPYLRIDKLSMSVLKFIRLQTVCPLHGSWS